MAERSPSPPVSRRENYYNSQRASLSSVGTSSRHESPGSRSRPDRARRDSRSRGYDLPDRYGNLNESAAPPPVENPTEGHLFRHRSLEEERLSRDRVERQRSTWPRPDQIEISRPLSRTWTKTSTRSARRPSRPTVAEDEYSLPEAWDNLNEFAGPSPVENPGEGGLYRHETLEEDRRRSQQRRQSRRLSEAASRRESGLRASGLEAAPPSQPLESTSSTALSALYQQHETNLEAQLQAAQSEAALALAEESQRRRRASRLATQLYTISYLILFAILGTLARLGIQWLTFYPGAPVVISVLWANFAGTLFMGFLSEDRRLFRDEWGSANGNSNSFSSFEKAGNKDSSDEEARGNHAKIKKTIPLYIGLATGFCGSLTSFSSFMRDLFLSLSNNLPSPINHPYPATVVTPTTTTTTVTRNGGDSLMAVMAVILLTITLSLGALKIGAHISIALDYLTPTIPFVLLRKILDRAVVPLAFGCWLGAIIMSIWPPDRPGGPSSHRTGPASWGPETWRGQALFACVFAPVGCLGRFYASLYLNGLSAVFPLGTFAVNVFGTAIEAMAFDLQHVPIGARGAVGGGILSCQVLQGVMDGFCGCLTTVSTWVAELNGLRRAHSYTYGAASVAAGLAMMLAIMGSVRWSVGWESPVCVT